MHSFCFAGFTDHFKKDIGPKTTSNQIKNIDYVYLINLDQRPDKLKNSLSQLSPYNIIPHRFSAVYGWDLSAEALRDLGVKFLPTMLSNRWINDGNNDLKRDFLTENFYGKTVFFPGITLGALGCTLSHLSILQNAYDANYETIWVMEDDITVKKDPHLLSTLIEKLDALVGKDGWDVLYTDLDSSPYFENMTGLTFPTENDFTTDLKGDLSFFWRPDVDLSDQTKFTKRVILNDDFVKIGSRDRTHSMIIRRSGIKKILDYEKKHHIFLPYDHEIATVPDIKLINLREAVVTYSDETSDTQTCQFDPKSAWETCKKATLAKLSQIPSWMSVSKAEKLMEFLRRKKPTTCIEIGAFAGSTTYTIASTLNFLKKGIVHAIDAWEHDAAIEGSKGEKTLQWWKNLNMEILHQQFQSLFQNTPLEPYCHPIKNRSEQVVSLFSDESIDFLYIDGNDSEKWNLENLELYFPKVKEGGYICIDRTLTPSRGKALGFLMKNCTWLKEDSLDDLVFFQKKTPIHEVSHVQNTKKLKFFNLDLHISVIADVRNILEELGHEVTNWTLSGHSWVFGKPRDPVDVVNEQTWELLDQDMCDRFYERYKDYLNQFDGFIVTHTPSFALLYEKFNKPIIIVNSTRYENPFTLYPSKWERLNEYLKEGVKKRKIFIISNNKADQAYLKHYTGIDSKYIPSLCLYTNAQYSGNKQGFISHAIGKISDRLFNQLQNKNSLQNKNCQPPYTWQNLYDFQTIVHFPYQISTMSLFEQYSANVPLFFPSKDFLKELHALYPNEILSQLSFFSVRNAPLPSLPKDLNNINDPNVLNHWIELADYYNTEDFPFIQYFNSVEDLEFKLQNTNFRLISNQMKEHNTIRKEKITHYWEEILQQVINSSKEP